MGDRKLISIPAPLPASLVPTGDPSTMTLYRGSEKVDGYWHGPAGDEVQHWRGRALAAEAEVRRLRAKCGEGTEP